MSLRTIARTLAVRSTSDDALWTYRYLRVALVAVVVFLGVSVALTWHSTGYLQPSISAFYYTTSHAGFIGALCAVGLGLLAHKGSTWPEDVLLNSAGFLAFVVALVPTERPDCAGGGDRCGQWLPSFDDSTGGVSNNIVALVIAALVGVAVYAIIAAVDPHPPTPRTPPRPPSVLWLWLARGIQFLVVAAGLAVLAAAPETFDNWAHGVAAAVMFACIIAVVVHYAVYASSPNRPSSSFVKTYWLTAGIMTATLIAAISLHIAALLNNDVPSLWLLFTEAVLIAGFAVFWITQTIDLWADEDKYCRSASVRYDDHNTGS